MLRHSFISYRVAQIQNVAQVALEAGNSPRMVFSNYRGLVRPADAEKWFGLTPEAGGSGESGARKGLAAMIGRQPDLMVVGEAAKGGEAVDLWH